MTIVDTLSKLLPDRLSLFFIDSLTDTFFRYKRKHLLKFYSQFIVPGSVVFDVGAYKGHLASVFESLGAKVVCFEPNPACSSLLRRRFLHHANITIVEQGLGARKGSTTFYVSPYRPGTSTFSRRWTTGMFSTQQGHRKITASITTLDSQIKKHGTPRFCKIDVEGFETEVLGGLSRKIPFISFEFTKEFFDDADACVKRLSSLGYKKFNVSLYSNFELELREWVPWSELRGKLHLMQRKDLHGDIYARI